MDLGEHIVLHGFVEDEYGELVIVKKLVGNHVKHVMESFPAYKHLELTRHADAHGIVVEGVLTVGEKDFTASARDSNLFFALDACLKSLAHAAH